MYFVNGNTLVTTHQLATFGVVLFVTVVTETDVIRFAIDVGFRFFA